ncbi:MAG: heavy metal-binding domain-containing protein [Bacteroidales bacterium]|nr:heavy metal-binding domain-containing protein [Bacteroidales bacterium]
MLMITTNVIQDKEIVKYYGMVTGEVIIGANIFKDILAGVRDIVGGRSSTYERVISEARIQATDEMREQAEALGANAVIGIDIDYETVGQGGSMLMVTIAGTAVFYQ